MESEYLIKRRSLMMGLTQPAPAKLRKSIAPLSKKRQTVQRQYRKIVKAAADESPFCEVQAPGCRVYMTGMNHKQKRLPSNITAADNLERCCSACNLYIEMHPGWAEANGHSISKFKK